MRFRITAILILLLITGCAKQDRNIYITDFSGFFGNFKGSFVLYDYGNNFYLKHNTEQCAKRFSPCSTFKIPNTLIGLETGVIPDESFTLKWDGIKHNIESWNQDQNLKSAIQNSVVWYYQEVARRIGNEKMKYYIDSINYGNKDISGGIDRFWLVNSLRISADEQVEFLKKLYSNNLPFSERNINILKKIIIVDSSSDYILRGKTGSGSIQDKNEELGWFIGYVTKKDSAFIFAANILGENADGKKAKEIVFNILKSLKIM